MNVTDLLNGKQIEIASASNEVDENLNHKQVAGLLEEIHSIGF